MRFKGTVAIQGVSTLQMGPLMLEKYISVEDCIGLVDLQRRFYTISIDLFLKLYLKATAIDRGAINMCKSSFFFNIDHILMLKFLFICVHYVS